MHCLRHLCMLAHNGVEHIFNCVFVGLCSLCCHFPWIVHFQLPLWVFFNVYILMVVHITASDN